MKWGDILARKRKKQVTTMVSRMTAEYNAYGVIKTPYEYELEYIENIITTQLKRGKKGSKNYYKWVGNDQNISFSHKLYLYFVKEFKDSDIFKIDHYIMAIRDIETNEVLQYPSFEISWPDKYDFVYERKV